MIHSIVPQEKKRWISQIRQISVHRGICYNSNDAGRVFEYVKCPPVKRDVVFNPLTMILVSTLSDLPIKCGGTQLAGGITRQSGQTIALLEGIMGCITQT